MESIHDHSYDFVSFLILGSLKQDIWEDITEKDKINTSNPNEITRKLKRFTYRGMRNNGLKKFSVVEAGEAVLSHQG